jgi:hypothetical protein
MPGVIGGTGDIGIGHHGKDHRETLLHLGHPEKGRAAQDQKKGRVLGPDAAECFIIGGGEFWDGNHLKAPGSQAGLEAGHSLPHAR